MHRLIGEAYISLLADAARFRPDADAKIKAALAGMRAKIPLDADAGPAEKKITALAAALKGLNGDVRLGTSGAVRDLGKLALALNALQARARAIPVDFNDAAGMKKLYGALAVIEDIRDRAKNIDGDGDMNRLLSKFYGVRGVIEGIETAASHIDPNGDIKGMLGKLDILKTDTARLSEMLANMRADANDKAFLAKIVSLQATVLRFAKKLRNMPITADSLPMEADLLKLWSMAETLQHKLSDMKVGASGVSIQPNVFAPGRNMSPVGMSGMSGSEIQMMHELAQKALLASADVEKLNSKLHDTGAVGAIAAAGLARLVAQNSMIISGGTGWNMLTSKIRLFGGALDRVLPAWMRAISLWHLGLDLIFEIAAAWVPATIAAAAFAAVATPTAQKIFGQWQNINTILDGVGGKTLPDLGKGFDTLQRAVQPQVMILFGEYMQTVGRNVGPLATALTKVGAVADKWGAQLVGWSAKASKSFASIVSVGATDLAMIGEGFHQVFRILGTLFHDMPGYVHVLLGVGDAFLTLTADVVQFLSPVIKAGLFLHGFMIYVGLAVTGILALGRAMAGAALATFLTRTTEGTYKSAAAVEGATGKFNRFGMAIGALAGNLAAGVAIGGKYIGNLFKLGEGAAQTGVKARIASAGTKLFGDAVGLITKIPVAGWVGIAAVAIGTILYFAFRHTTTAAVAFQRTMNALIASSNATNIGTNLQLVLTKTEQKIKATNVAYKQQQALTQAVQQNILHASGASVAGYNNTSRALDTYNNTLTTAVNDANTYGIRMSSLTRVFGSAGAAQAALNLVGIKASDIATQSNAAWAREYIQLVALAKSYGYMGQQAGAAGAQLNTLRISAGNTTKNVQTLTQAEGQWIAMVTGGDTAFTAFEQGQMTLAGVMKQGAKSGATLTVTVGKLREQYALTGTKMNGTTASALAARQAFDQQITAGTSLFQNLQMLAAAGGHTAGANHELAKSGKDIIAQLLPMAAGSKEATSEVYALAQIVGYTGKNSFPQLAKWVGNTKGAEADLNSQQAKLTEGMANLSQAAKNLGNTLDTSITSAQAAAIAKTLHLTDVTTHLASAVQDSKGKLTSAAQVYAGQYFNALIKSGMGTTQAHQYLDAYLARLGYAPSVIHKLDTALDVNRDKHLAVAGAMHASRDAADKLHGALGKLAAGSPYNAKENTTFSGSGSVTARANIPGQPALTSHLNFLPHMAAGYQVPPGHGPAGRDSHLAVLAPGELVIPTSHAAMAGPMAKKWGIPGLSGGGLVNGATGGGSGSSSGSLASAVGTILSSVGAAGNRASGAVGNMVSGLGNDIPFGRNNTAKFYQETAQAFASSMLTSVKNGLAQAGSPFTGHVPGGTANGLLIARYLLANGFNASAAAGIAATIFGESAWNPESVGSGGFGLIGWTGNTIGLPAGYHGPTGNMQRDMAAQLAGVVGYINANGGKGPINAAGNPVMAGDIFSSQYERPLVALSDTRPGIANQLFAQLTSSPAVAKKAIQTQKQVAGRVGRNRPHSGGGVISEPVLGRGQWSGIPYSFAENGQPEIVSKVGQAPGHGQGRMQAQTTFQGKTIINQNNMIIKLLQQMPYAYAQAQATGAGKGVSHGYFGAQY